MDDEQHDAHVWARQWIELTNRERLSPMELRAMVQQDWPPATMTREQLHANRGCPYGGGMHDCTCKGECPWRIRDAKQMRLSQYRRRGWER